MNRSEAIEMLELLMRSSYPSVDEDPGSIASILLQVIGFEYGVHFALRYPEYTVALRSALHDVEASRVPENMERFLVRAGNIIADHPLSRMTEKAT